MLCRRVKSTASLRTGTRRHALNSGDTTIIIVYQRHQDDGQDSQRSRLERPGPTKREQHMGGRRERAVRGRDATFRPGAQHIQSAATLPKTLAWKNALATTPVAPPPSRSGSLARQPTLKGWSPTPHAAKARPARRRRRRKGNGHGEQVGNLTEKRAGATCIASTADRREANM